MTQQEREKLLGDNITTNYIRFGAIALEGALHLIYLIWAFQYSTVILVFNVSFIIYIIFLLLPFSTRVDFANHGCGFVTLMIFLILRGIWSLYEIIIVFTVSN